MQVRSSRRCVASAAQSLAPRSESLTTVRTPSIAVAALIALAACGGGNSTSSPSTRGTTRIGAPKSQVPSRPADPSQLVLRASDYPTGTLDEQGPADLYDEAPGPFEKTLEAAGLVPSQGAFTRSFHISKSYYGSIDSLAVVVASPRLASDFFRDGAPSTASRAGQPNQHRSLLPSGSAPKPSRSRVQE
jgi:hypothetical protein